MYQLLQLHQQEPQQQEQSLRVLTAAGLESQQDGAGKESVLAEAATPGLGNATMDAAGSMPITYHSFRIFQFHTLH